jgi:type VI protein secretion system component VasK
VLGNSKEVTPAEIATYRQRYTSDYKKAWQTYLADAKVTPYRNIEDAKAKLEQMSNQRSFLLSLLGLASENTAVNEEMRAAFQPVRAVAPDSKTFDPAKDYLKALTMLTNRLDAAAASGTGPAHDQAVGTIREAETNVRDSVSAISLLPGFKGEADESVKRILLDPLLSINPLLAKQDSDAVNGAGGELCTSYNALANLYPFSEAARRQASPEDVDAIFQPDRGKMWQLYNNYLGDSLDCGAGGCRPKASPRYPLQPSFIEFFSRLLKLSRLLYSSQIQVTVQRYNSVRQLDFSTDGAHVTVTAGASGAIPWNLHNPRPLKVTGDFEGVDPGEILFESREPWALFQWLYGDSVPESRRSGVFHWIPRFGQRTPATLKNGHTKEYQIEIRAGDPPSLLDLQSLQLGPCRLPAAR